MPIDDLAMTPIETWDEPIVAEVPADVADAVKRAIAALELHRSSAVVAPILQPSEFVDRHRLPLAAPLRRSGASTRPGVQRIRPAVTRHECRGDVRPVAVDQEVASMQPTRRRPSLPMSIVTGRTSRPRRSPSMTTTSRPRTRGTAATSAARHSADSSAASAAKIADRTRQHRRAASGLPAGAEERPEQFGRFSARMPDEHSTRWLSRSPSRSS